MSGINATIDLIKQMRGKTIEYINRDCRGCDETAQSLREHICFSTPWYMHCSDYWTQLLNDLELNKEPKQNLLKYFAILSDLDPVKVDPENEEIIKKMVIQLIKY